MNAQRRVEEVQIDGLALLKLVRLESSQKYCDTEPNRR
jgi:hypothetical protein